MVQDVLPILLIHMTHEDPRCGAAGGRTANDWPELSNGHV